MKRGHLPQGSRYSTVAKFAEDLETRSKGAWSITLEFPTQGAMNQRFEAVARFLVPNAPWERLKTGCVFDLYEGNLKTAKVTVL